MLRGRSFTGQRFPPTVTLPVTELARGADIALDDRFNVARCTSMVAPGTARPAGAITVNNGDASAARRRLADNATNTTKRSQRETVMAGKVADVRADANVRARATATDALPLWRDSQEQRAPACSTVLGQVRKHRRAGSGFIACHCCDSPTSDTADVRRAICGVPVIEVRVRTACPRPGFRSVHRDQPRDARLTAVSCVTTCTSPRCVAPDCSNVHVSEPRERS
jgi:hypothetical protein